MRARASQLVHMNVCKTGGAVTFAFNVLFLFLEQKSAVMMQHAHLHKSGVVIGTLMPINRNMSEVVSGGQFSLVYCPCGDSNPRCCTETQATGSNLHCNWSLFILIYSSLEYNGGPFWTFKCARTGSAAFSCTYTSDHTAERLPLLLENKVLL